MNPHKAPEPVWETYGFRISWTYRPSMTKPVRNSKRVKTSKKVLQLLHQLDRDRRGNILSAVCRNTDIEVVELQRQVVAKREVRCGVTGFGRDFVATK